MSIAVNLRNILITKTIIIIWYITKQVSPPFKGGVAGIAVFGMFTILLSRPGWLKRIQKKWTYFS